MNWDAILWLVLGILGAALITGGIVAYRGSPRVGVRAFGASATAAGIAMWAVVLIIVPVSSSSDGSPEPTVEKGVAGTASHDLVFLTGHDWSQHRTLGSRCLQLISPGMLSGSILHAEGRGLCPIL